MKTAIVLAGGGSKGAYEVGAWKALKKLHISYDIVTGTSVGALNGAFMVQQDLKSAEWMWENINFNMIFSNFEANYSTVDGKKKIFENYTKGILFHGGMDVSELEKTIKKYIDVDKFYQSKINYGLVTVNFSDLKPVEIEKKNIPKELLRDYLMASATCFPAFKKKKIGETEFIDGGYYDNLPINLAIRLGAEKVIAVNIGKIGITQPIKNKNVEIVMIEPHNDLGSFLIFDKELSHRMFTLGYNDTMKVFGKYDGSVFTFKSRQLKKFVKKYYDVLKKNLISWISSDKIMNSMAETNYYYDFLTTTDLEVKQQLMLEFIEDLGVLFHLEETVVYSERSFNQTLIDICTKESTKESTLLERGIVLEQLKNFSHSRILILYLYKKILTVKTAADKKRLSSLATIFQKEFLEALYLTMLK